MAGLFFNRDTHQKRVLENGYYHLVVLWHKNPICSGVISACYSETWFLDLTHVRQKVVFWIIIFPDKNEISGF